MRGRAGELHLSLTHDVHVPLCCCCLERMLGSSELASGVHTCCDGVIISSMLWCDIMLCCDTTARLCVLGLPA